MSHKDKVKTTYSYSAKSFFCEACGGTRLSTNTTIRIYKSGREVQVDHCEVCKYEQTTEYWRGPTVRIQNGSDTNGK